MSIVLTIGYFMDPQARPPMLNICLVVLVRSKQLLSFVLRMKNEVAVRDQKLSGNLVQSL